MRSAYRSIPDQSKKGIWDIEIKVRLANRRVIVNKYQFSKSTSSDAQSDSQSTEDTSEQFFESEGIDNSRIEELILNLSQAEIENGSEGTGGHIVNSESNRSNRGTESIPQIDVLHVSDQNSDGGANVRSTNSILHNSNENLENMVQTQEEFFEIASAIVNYKYDGEPKKLESFIANIEFLDTMTKAEMNNTYLSYIRHKLEGRALEGMPKLEDLNGVEEITTILRKNIKAEPSTNIEGKFTTLRIVKGDIAKFAEDAEKLAEKFRRSLVIEGFTQNKASEMAIKKTQELCRRLSKNEAAKAVIDMNRYEAPSEVIATFLIQNETARKEKQGTQ